MTARPSDTLLMDIFQRLGVVETQNTSLIKGQEDAQDSRREIHKKLETVSERLAAVEPFVTRVNALENHSHDDFVRRLEAVEIISTELKTAYDRAVGGFHVGRYAVHAMYISLCALLGGAFWLYVQFPQLFGH